MRPTALKCPECGAKLDSADGRIQCRYCGTEFLADAPPAAPPPPPPPPSSTPPSSTPPLEPPPPEPRPAPPTGRLKRAVVGAFVGVGLLVLAAVFFATRSVPTPPPNWTPPPEPLLSEAPPVAGPRTKWASDRPLFGPKGELVGVFASPDGSHTVGAVDEEGARVVWMSPPLDQASDDDPTLWHVDAGTLVVDLGGGALAAYDLPDGGERWSIRLSDIVTSVHATFGPAGADVLVVNIEGGRATAVDPATGEVRGAADLDTRKAAREVPSSRSGAASAGFRRLMPAWLSGPLDRDAFEGVRVATALESADDSLGARVCVALGERTQGSPVPTLVRYATPAVKGVAPAEVWRKTVPASDPLEAEVGLAPDSKLALSFETAVVAYRVGGSLGSYRIAAFDTEDGQRKWDVEVPAKSPFVSVGVRRSKVHVTLWDGLFVLDAATGETLDRMAEYPLTDR